MKEDKKNIEIFKEIKEGIKEVAKKRTSKKK